MSDNKIIENYLNKILSSIEFKESKTYKDLLSYLVQSSLDGEHPKEANIALKVLHKDINSDLGNDSSVRVYVHNLRKKLDSYYRNEGRSDQIKISIPKGHYNVEFDKESLKQSSNKLNFSFLVISVLSVITCIILITKYSILNDNDDPIVRNNIFLRDYLESNKPILIILGDYYFFVDSTEQELFVRNVYINSDKDLEEYIAKNEDKRNRLKSNQHTYLSKLAPWGLKAILPALVLQDKKVDIKLSSQLQWSDLTKYNIIYIGTFRTLGILENIVFDLGFSHEKSVLNYKHIGSTESMQYLHKWNTKTGYCKDYAVAIKVLGPNENTFLFFLSFYDTGNIALLDYFSQPDSRKVFESEYLMKADSPYFKALFEVDGYERTVLDVKLLDFDRISRQTKIGTNINTGE